MATRLKCSVVEQIENIKEKIRNIKNNPMLILNNKKNKLILTYMLTNNSSYCKCCQCCGNDSDNNKPQTAITKPTDGNKTKNNNPNTYNDLINNIAKNTNPKDIINKIKPSDDTTEKSTQEKQADNEDQTNLAETTNPVDPKNTTEPTNTVNETKPTTRTKKTTKYKNTIKNYKFTKEENDKIIAEYSKVGDEIIINNDFDGFNNLMENADKLANTYITSDFDFLPLLSLYGILEKNYNTFINSYNYIKDQYEKNKKSNESSSFFDYISKKEIIMAEIYSKDTNEVLTDTINGFINTIKKIHTDERDVALTKDKFGTKHNLNKNKKTCRRDIDPYNQIKICFEQILNKNNTNKNIKERILRQFGNCFQEKKIKADDKEKYFESDKNIILPIIQQICTFHNLTFIILANSTLCNVTEDVKHNYEVTGEAINRIYKNIVKIVKKMLETKTKK